LDLSRTDSARAFGSSEHDNPVDQGASGAPPAPEANADPLLVHVRVHTYCRAVEEAVYAAYGRSRAQYADEICRLTMALRHNGRRLLARYAPVLLPCLDDARLAAGTLEERRRRAVEARVFACRRMMHEATESERHTLVCRACKKQAGIVFTPVQTRSADEGMTIFCECKGCGFRWRYRG
jgi:hypothetical protein